MDCNSCGRVISSTTSNGGKSLLDNRHICGLCIPNIVKTNLDIENSRNSLTISSKISGKIEYSKNWATKKLEDLSDIRLNNQHLFVSLATNF